MPRTQSMSLTHVTLQYHSNVTEIINSRFALEHRYAITAGRDGKVKAWNLDPKSLQGDVSGRELVPMGVKSGVVKHQHMRQFRELRSRNFREYCG